MQGFFGTALGIFEVAFVRALVTWCGVVSFPDARAVY